MRGRSAWLSQYSSFTLLEVAATELTSVFCYFTLLHLHLFLDPSVVTSVLEAWSGRQPFATPDVSNLGTNQARLI